MVTAFADFLTDSIISTQEETINSSVVMKFASSYGIIKFLLSGQALRSNLCLSTLHFQKLKICKNHHNAKTHKNTDHGYATKKLDIANTNLVNQGNSVQAFSKDSTNIGITYVRRIYTAMKVTTKVITGITSAALISHLTFLALSISSISLCRIIVIFQVSSQVFINQTSFSVKDLSNISKVFQNSNHVHRSLRHVQAISSTF